MVHAAPQSGGKAFIYHLTVGEAVVYSLLIMMFMNIQEHDDPFMMLILGILLVNISRVA